MLPTIQQSHCKATELCTVKLCVLLDVIVNLRIQHALSDSGILCEALIVNYCGNLYYCLWHVFLIAIVFIRWHCMLYYCVFDHCELQELCLGVLFVYLNYLKSYNWWFLWYSIIYSTVQDNDRCSGCNNSHFEGKQNNY